jgi:hypothetical protein
MELVNTPAYCKTATIMAVKSIIIQVLLGSGEGRTVVESSPHHNKVKGFSPAGVGGIGGEKNAEI